MRHLLHAAYNAGVVLPGGPVADCRLRLCINYAAFFIKVFSQWQIFDFSHVLNAKITIT